MTHTKPLDETKAAGTTYANPLTNIPLTLNTMTPQGHWDDMFRNSLSGQNDVGIASGRGPTIPEGQTPAVPATPPASLIAGVMNSIGASAIPLALGGAVNSNAPAPTLSTLAAGGQNHAQQWGAQVGNVGIGNANPDGSNTSTSLNDGSGDIFNPTPAATEGDSATSGDYSFVNPAIKARLNRPNFNSFPQSSVRLSSKNRQSLPYKWGAAA